LGVGLGEHHLQVLLIRIRPGVWKQQPELIQLFADILCIGKDYLQSHMQSHYR
jgi:hypothetical protein